MDPHASRPVHSITHNFFSRGYYFNTSSLVHTGGCLYLVPLFKPTAVSAGALAFSGVSTCEEALSLSGHNERWAKFHRLPSLKRNVLGLVCCCNDKGLRTRTFTNSELRSFSSSFPVYILLTFFCLCTTLALTWAYLLSSLSDGKMSSFVHMGLPLKSWKRVSPVVAWGVAR